VENWRPCSEDDGDNDGSCDVIAEPEVVFVHRGDVTATVDAVVVTASASVPEVVTYSGGEAVGSCVWSDENSDVIRDVTYGVMYEVVEGKLESVVSCNPCYDKQKQQSVTGRLMFIKFTVK